eukprot:COSAG02_NODE_63480_length_263_cov_0.628049_1_plen_48_part_10
MEAEAEAGAETLLAAEVLLGEAVSTCCSEEQQRLLAVLQQPGWERSAD